MPCVMSEYQYSSLPGGSIRLLRLMPHQGALIQGELFDYSLVDSDKGSHLYEALSYVWGDWDNTQSIAINNRNIPITANLHEALLSLRDASLERVIWIDALCINQKDLDERRQQIGLMAEIYSKASCVIVWLGGQSLDSNQVFTEIRLAAEKGPATPDVDKQMRKSILALLQRKWFRRVWVRTRHSSSGFVFATNAVDSGSSGGCRSPTYPD